MANGVMLRIEYADGHAEERALPAGRFTIGREAGDIVLNDAKVSSAHARLEVQAQHVAIVDLGSRNGTLDASGQRLTGAHVLVPGQPVQLGFCRLVLVRALAAPDRSTEALEAVDAAQIELPRARRPSITRARFDDARRDVGFWRWLVRACGLTFVLAFLFAAAALSAGSDPATFVGGMTALASGGMLAWLVKRRDEALAEYKDASIAAALGTAGIAKRETGSSPCETTRSLWQHFRGLPVWVQALILVYAWWLVLPLWLLDSMSKAAASPGTRG